MNVTNTKSIDVKTNELPSKVSSSKNGNKNFSDELKIVKDTEDVKKNQDTKNDKSANKDAEKQNDVKKAGNNDKAEKVDSALNGLNDTIDELSKLTQKDEPQDELIKIKNFYDDNKNKNEEFGLIDNNMNLQEPQDKINFQMSANMNFNSDGQPFAEFVNQDKSRKMASSAKDLAEEKAIMSTMEENIAIANKNMAMSKTKTVENEQGVHKVDKRTNIIVDTIVNYDNIIMNKADVEFFANLAENGFLNIDDVKNTQKSAHVSKTLMDMLAKAMNDNKPIRIDFDNNISVIIKIDRAGKISADFLPSSQVAEAYLKENLPLLRQRFDDNNIDYNELNQRQRKQDSQDNRKKERKDE